MNANLYTEHFINLPCKPSKSSCTDQPFFARLLCVSENAVTGDVFIKNFYVRRGPPAADEPDCCRIFTEDKICQKINIHTARLPILRYSSQEAVALDY